MEKEKEKSKDVITEIKQNELMAKGRRGRKKSKNKKRNQRGKNGKLHVTKQLLKKISQN